MADDSSKALLQELVFVELMQEVEYGAPGARLSARLRAALERMCPGERAALVSRRAGGCAPLFVAARRGNAELVEYLVQVCGAPLEQRGEYSAPAERAAHHVTPLWAAAVAGRLAALRVLADAGADLDARSDSGSTPLRSACFMTHLDVVRFLCSRGADVRARNHNGGTCLINSVQCARLTRYLIAQGAEVDARDAHGKTALHYAIQEHQMKTVRVLLEAGASPLVVSACGDDALQTACVRGAAPAADLLLATGLYSHERCADALDLLGATHLDEFNDVGAALAAWRRSTSIRYSGAQHVRKRGVAPACAALGGAREWQTPEELEAAAGDAETLRAHATLVAVRVLGERHRNTMFRLMYRGAWYADAGRPQRCAALWTWALRTRIQADTLLHTDTYHTLCALTRLLVDMCFLSGALDEDLQEEQGERAERSEPPSHEDVMCVLRLVARALPESQRLVSVRPWCASQAECWDRALRCLVHLAVLAAATAPGGGPAAAAGELRHGTDLVDELAALARLSPATHAGGESLLHLACSRLTTVRSAYFPTEARPRALFPSVRGARLLVACGARAAARDAAGRTPLHVAAAPYNYSAPLVEALRRGGAHACTPDARGTTALELLPPAARRELAAGVTLACLAARALPSRVAPLALPRTLLPFLELHRVPHPASASAPAPAHHDTSHPFMTNV